LEMIENGDKVCSRSALVNGQNAPRMKPLADNG